MRKLILLNALLTLTFGYSQNATKAALMSIEIEKKRQEKICFEKKRENLYIPLKLAPVRQQLNTLSGIN